MDGWTDIFSIEGWNNRWLGWIDKQMNCTTIKQGDKRIMFENNNIFPYPLFFLFDMEITGIKFPVIQAIFEMRSINYFPTVLIKTGLRCRVQLIIHVVTRESKCIHANR